MQLAHKYLKKIPQYTRNARHLQSVLKHGTPKKLVNLARAEIARKQRRIELNSYPYLLIIDPCNYCNLRCPLCPTGNGQLERKQAMLSLDHFRQYFDPLADYLFEAYLHNWGESLLNKNVFKMIEHAQQRNVGTNLSTNFSDTTSSELDALLDSGLEYLIVSLDGTSPETYVKYRVRGHYEKVVHNLGEIIRRRNQRRMKTPVIEWQFIVMRQNEHEIAQAEQLAKKLGVDLLRFIPVGLPCEAPNRKDLAEEWFPRTVQGRAYSPTVEQQFGQADKPGPCFYLYRSMVVNPDGGVSPCCVVYRGETDFAQLPVSDALAMWNNDKYKSARALFSPHNAPLQVPTTCDGCDLFTKYDKPRLTHILPPNDQEHTGGDPLVQIAVGGRR